jgi:conjugative transfer region lipoprotein (TIGR03751 family)
MQQTQTPFRLFAILLITLVATGCATKPPNYLTSGPTMSEVVGDGSGREVYQQGRVTTNWAATNNLHAYTREAHTELEGHFARLPNPDLCMYVLPHLSAEGASVPGYTSCFPMYERNHYAMPGEVY